MQKGLASPNPALPEKAGFAPILIVLLIAVLGIGGYFWFNYSNNQTKTVPYIQTTQAPQSMQNNTPNTPEEVVKSYYNIILNCEHTFDNAVMNNRDQSDQAGKIRNECLKSADNKYTLNKSNVSIGFGACKNEQNIPAEIHVEKTTVNKDKAESIIDSLFIGSGGNSYRVSLQLVDGQWKITDVSCANPAR